MNYVNIATDSKERFEKNTELPNLSSIFAEFTNEWYGKRKAINFILGDQNVYVSSRYHVLFNKDKSDYIVQVFFGDDPITLYLGRSIMQTLTDIAGLNLDINILSDEDFVLIFEHVLGAIFDEIERRLSVTISVNLLQKQGVPKDNHLLNAAIAFEPLQKTEFFCFSLSEREIWKEILVNQIASNTENIYPLERTIKITLSLRYKTINLTLLELGEIGPDDIILLGSQSHYNKALEICVFNQIIWYGSRELGSGRVTISDDSPYLSSVIETAGLEVAKKMTDEKTASDIDDITVEVSFEIGRKLVSISELRQAEEGSIITFPTENNEEVRILVNGKAIGWGALIKVDNAVGVKIERLFTDG